MQDLRCETAAAARRILAAIGSGSVPALEAELDRSAGACRGLSTDSCAAERAEVLEAAVESLRGALPLLKHLAGATT